MAETYKIVNNEQLMHFEIKLDDDIAYLEYRYYKNDIAFMHTHVPDSMERKGVASALAAHAFAFAKQHGKPVMVYCPFVASYLKKHSELREQLDKQYL